MNNLDEFAADLNAWFHKPVQDIRQRITLQVAVNNHIGEQRFFYQGEVRKLTHFLNRPTQFLITSEGTLTGPEFQGRDVDGSFNWVNQAEDNNHTIGPVLVQTNPEKKLASISNFKIGLSKFLPERFGVLTGEAVDERHELMNWTITYEMSRELGGHPNPA